MAQRSGADTIVPSLASISKVFAKVSKQYDTAIKAQSVYFYPSKISVIKQNVPGTSTNIPWKIRCVPALLDKAKEKQRKTESNEEPEDESKKDTKPQQNSKDVFLPPYHPDLLVEQFTKHTILLNKFCVVPKHFLLVTKVFEPQTMPPAPEMLAIAYRILIAHELQTDRDKTKQLLAFYNCGEVSGASQPHQHVQFAELDGIPVEELLNSSIPKDGKEDEVFALPLPYQHFVSLIKKSEIEDGKILSNYLGMKLLSLLDSLFQARISSTTENVRNGNSDNSIKNSSPSWNLLMTHNAMHLIPRKFEEFQGLRKQAENQGTLYVEDGVELIGNLSINSLGYAGHLLVKSDKEFEHLQDYKDGIINVLKECGVPPIENVTT